jgi:hypothetical protein
VTDDLHWMTQSKLPKRDFGCLRLIVDFSPISYGKSLSQYASLQLTHEDQSGR